MPAARTFPAPMITGHGSGHGTQSVCPVCLKTVPARYGRLGDDIILAKNCPEHGEFAAVVWRGNRPSFGEWKKPKIPSSPLQCHTESTGNCPRDCGLCTDHRQHTCTALLEITARCNLRCPVCFADAGSSENTEEDDPSLETISFWYDRVLEASGTCNIQISGGEPTVRDDLPEIIAMGRDKGFQFIQLNTNGLRPAQSPEYARALKDAGLASVFLQFDGTNDEVYTKLRGRPLWEEKMRAVAHCTDAGLGVVLVPVLAPGVNEDQPGKILDFALNSGPGVRGVHFQPLSLFGRFSGFSADGEHITLPEIMRALEEQTEGMVRAADFRPPSCEHALCSFHANYLRTEKGLRLSGKKKSCCSTPEPLVAAEGARRSKAYTAGQWSGIADSPEQVAAGSCCSTPSGEDGLALFLDQVRTWNFSISAMAFQDAVTMDLDRVKGCCIHVVSPDGRLVPFCAWNLTAEDGTPLHRGKEPQK